MNSGINEIGIVLLEIGIIFIFSLISLKFLKRFNIPAVLGLMLGGAVIGLITLFNGYGFASDIYGIKLIITELALGWIGFDIGNEINIDLLRKKGKAFGLILLAESFGALFFVTISMYILLNDLLIASLMGAIAMATAPAATSAVLTEFKAKGDLTQTTLFVIAFDDIVAIIIVNILIGIGIPTTTNTNGMETVLIALFTVVAETGASVLIGAVFAALTILIFRKFKPEARGNQVEWIIGIALTIMGITILLNGSVILTMFIYGMVLKTLGKKGNDECEEDQQSSDNLNEPIITAEIVTSPIVFFFFVLIGLSMDFSLIFGSPIILLLATIYFVSRILGKGIGTFIVGKFIGLEKKILNNLPLCLVTQAGVALGLAGLISNKLTAVGMLVEASLVITLTGIAVMLAEITGPLTIKKAIVSCGEANNCE